MSMVSNLIFRATGQTMHKSKENVFRKGIYVFQVGINLKSDTGIVQYRSFLRKIGLLTANSSLFKEAKYVLEWGRTRNQDING